MDGIGDDERRTLFNCVKIIISKCVGNNFELIKDIAVCFADNEAISKSQRKKILDDVKDGFFKQAAENLMDSVYRRDTHNWVSNLLIAAADTDFPGSEDMSLLLIKLCGKPVPPSDIANLIYLWNELLACQEQSYEMWKRLWPGKVPSSTGDDWVLELILQCCLEYETLEGKQFLSSVQNLIPQERKKNEKSDQNGGESMQQDSPDEVPPPILLSNGEVLECAKKVISNYVSLDKDSIEEFALAFSDGKLISKSHRNKVKSDIKKGVLVDALSKLTQEWCEDELWKKRLLDVISEEDFPGDERLASILNHFVHDKPVMRSVASLVHSWPEWENSLQAVQQLVKLTWMEEKAIPSVDKWPTLIILKCLHESHLESVSQFAEGVQKLVHERSLSEQETSGDKPTATRLDSGPKKKQKLEQAFADKKQANKSLSDAAPQLKGMEITGQGGGKTDTPHKVTHIKRGSQNISSDKGNASKGRDETSEAKPLPQAKDAEELKSLHSSDTSEEIEFRVVVAEGSTVRASSFVCMYTNLYGDWTPVKLHKHQRRPYYSCSIPILKHKRSFEYKYYIETHRSYTWETFSHIGNELSNRFVHSEDLGKQRIFCDVACFQERYLSRPWRDLVHDSIAIHLVHADALTMHCERDSEKICDFSNEIFSWMRNVKRGYAITQSYYRGRVMPSMEAMQRSFVEWLRHNRKVLLKTGEKRDVLRLILSTLTLVAAMHHEEFIITEKSLLRDIFVMLGTHMLTEDDQKLLYKEITQECEARTDSVQDAIIALFRAVKENPVAEFLLALPLYWLVADKGNILKEMTKSQGQGGLLFQRSHLPSARQLKWSEIKSRFKSSGQQQDFIKLSQDVHEIYKINSWIVGSYQYMLNEQSLIQIVATREENEIGGSFPLDAVLHQLLHACLLKHVGAVKISDFEQLSDYFVCTFQSMIDDAESNVCEGDTERKEDAERNLDIPKNILQSMAALFADVVKNCYDYNQTVRTNNDMLWCLEITRLTSQLANALSYGDTQSGMQDIKKSLTDIRTSVTNRLHKCKIDDEQLKYWNSLMTVNWTDEKFDTKWKEVVKNEMKQKIANVWQHKDEEFLNYYAVKLETVELEEAVEACFSEKAFRCTEVLLAKYGSAETRKERGGLLSQASSAFRNVMSRISTPRFIQIFDKLFVRELQKAAVDAHSVVTSDDVRALTFLFSWTFALQFYRLFNTKDALGKFSSDTRERITLVASTFRSIVESLRSGDILVKHLKAIQKNKEKFLELQGTICLKQESSVDVNPKYWSHIIDHRMSQLHAYETAADHMRAFLSACSKLDESGDVMVNTTELKEKLRDSAKADDEMLSRISPDPSDGPSVTQPTSFFQLPPATLKRFRAISFIKDSKVFHELWHQSAMDAKSESPDSGYDLGDSGLWRVRWKDVINDVWKGTHSDIMDLVQRVDAGTLTLDHATEYFQRCSGEPEEIKREIDMLHKYYLMVIAEKEQHQAPTTALSMAKKQGAEKESQADDPGEDSNEEDDLESKDFASSEEDNYTSEDDQSQLDEDESPDSDDEDYEPVENIGRRTRQLSCYFQLEKAKETIDLLLLLRDGLKLTGDFKAIESQKNSVEDKSLTLDDLPDDQEIPFICGIPQKDVDCLRIFIEERELIHWLKERMHNISEVQVMCDLAMISAGETPFELDIVSCLLSAVMGFAPLIFELEPTAGLDELLRKCNAVWKNRDGDGKLMDKWKDTGRQLAWFKGIENFHGSVEKQSLMLAQEINERGIYTVKREGPIGGLNSKDCIRLALLNKDENGKSDTYHLDALCDLQSKLMLIAGEAEMGQTDVANFVEVLNSIQILAGTFVKLVSAGCMLFNDWSAVITCDHMTTKTCNNLLIQVKFGEESQALVGTGSLPDLGKLSTILNQSLERWNNYIDAKRSKHYFLNEYNIQQMIYLCHELAICKDAVPDQANTLLSCVAEYASIERLQELLNEATKIRDDEELTKAEDKDSDVEMQDDDKTAKDVSVVEAKNRAVRHLMDREDLEEDIAKAAVQAEGFEDLDNCLNWSLLNAFEEDAVKRLCKKFNEDADDDKTAKDVSVVEAKNRAVRHLMDREDLEEDIAKAAVQAEGFEDLDNCLNWSLLNRFEEDDVKRLCKKFNEDAGFSHEEREIRVITSILHKRSQNTLSEVIKRLQQGACSLGENTLLDYVKTICIGYHDETQLITLQDSLSVEHLGRFLHLLHSDARKEPIVRELMQPLEKGRPNLLVCQEQEILPSVLRLYMFNEDQPLPSTSEVHVCSEQTTANEIERFMRRAMCKCDSRDRLIFSLAFADKLSFNVSTATEKIFNQLSQGSRNAEYQLVILLSKQQHYLATCFDKYLIEGKWITAGIDIPKYVEKHLKVSDANLTTSTACVDAKHSMVKIVSSTRSGVGKSLHVQRLTKQLNDIFRHSMLPWCATTIRLLEHSLDLDYVIDRLYRSFAPTSKNSDPMLIHIDLTPAVQKGIDAFAFNLFVLGKIQDSNGRVWRRHPNHLYMLEMTDCGRQGKGRLSPRHVLNLLPSVKCLAPKEVLERPAEKEGGEWLGMDQEEFRSSVFQRPYQYLTMYDKAQQNWGMLDTFAYRAPTGSPEECIRTLLRHCCINNPSWAQLRHFASFLNVQLENCENSVFCDQSIVGQELRGLKAFAVRFMVRMSQDFATPSLNISDESSAGYDDEDGDENAAEDLKIYQFRRKWEESTHPYLFFNEDRTTMTFINVNISDEGDLLDRNGDIVEPGIISKQLVGGLKLQRVSLDLNFDSFSREQKLRALRQVMGIENDFDPDPTYELTTDNVLKILAIYMRFRCRIPVIIMGETGCGKTRMVEFLSKLKSGGPAHGAGSMITLKIHGGITVANIYDSVRKAQEIAVQNTNNYRFDTILFYDEANTTEAIYAIKEVMCDLTIDGNSFKQSRLKLVAACNPYKQLSKDAIKKLEDSGLGYRIKTSDTAHLFGNVPMRTLVYRVVALPPSMQPFVWDFGQLSDEAERIYIQQMTKKLGQNMGLDRETLRLINAIFTEAQNYMKSRRDECRYVSLRDVERCVITYQWFYERKDVIYPLIEKEVEHRYQRMNRETPDCDEALRTLLLTIGICYHASLDDRLKFREKISYAFGLEGLLVGELQIREEISAAQSVFLRNVKMDDNIAANEALQENVFMMTVCADMRIPLFLIGKPGSSKSLAKTIVGDNMQGNTSRSPLYKKLKQVHILSYQCSALTDAAGIESVFKQCAQLQANQDLQSYTAVVVLDEIGLAEDSANMPLKVLHPLLECGSTNNTSLTEFDVKRKVGFVGISNWALDPAKMNRGIFVTRNKPSKDDLKKTAKGIFENHKNKINENSELLEKLTESYMKVYEAQDVEYFGLRDYYSLIKMVHTICTATKDASITFEDVANAIHRNFSGGKSSHFETFRRNIQHLYKNVLMSSVPIRKMISDNLREKESRFLLLLTNQFSASSLLHLCLADFDSGVQVIFGSSFPGDHNYTDICRNINRIKVCMETGKTVVLLNMTEIHESLYDALNQHYVTFGGQRYVDLGLGGHRVKCRIADDFRLIVIEQKEVVYAEYPIPLINRLEKHHLDSRSLLSAEQKRFASSLTDWTEKFASIRGWDFTGKDAFVGYHEDTVCSVVLMTDTTDEKVHRAVLLQSAAMDAVFRLPESDIGGETETIQELYLHHQVHDSLLELLKEAMRSDGGVPLLEVTSFSNILSETDRCQIEAELRLNNGVMLLSLEQFETEQEFANKLDEFFKSCEREKGENEAGILLIQCSQAQTRGQLLACAKHCLNNKLKGFHAAATTKSAGKAIVALLLSTEREGETQYARGTLLLQHARDNRIVYVDELRPTNKDIAPASHFYKKSLCDILRMGAEELETGKRDRSLVNVLALLRDCICEAVAKVKSRLCQSKRYFERVKILSDLFVDDRADDDDNGPTTGSHFRKILFEKMIALYSESGEENNFVLEKDWIVGEACNRDSLQEGGTFRKTLWLCLKRHISRLIAFVVSVTDKQENLDLLAQSSNDRRLAWKLNMWLEIFRSMQLSWSVIGRAQEFLITSPPQHKTTVPCIVPFSFDLHDFFVSRWETLTQQNTPNVRQIFFTLFRQSPLFKIVAKAVGLAKVAKIMGFYAEDLVKYLYIPGSGRPEELEVVKKIVYDIAMKMLLTQRNDPQFTNGDEIALVFVAYKEQSVYLDLVSEMFRAYPELLKKADEWIEKWRRENEEFLIHVSAFESLIDLLEEKAMGLNNPQVCLEWKALMAVAKRIFKKLVNHIGNQRAKDRILKRWVPLTLVFLTIEHLVPSENRQDIFDRYVSVISPHVKRLWRGFIGKDVRSHQTLRITCNVLRSAYEDIRLGHLINWDDFTCKLCRKRVAEPAFLPCGHFACHECLRRLTAAADTGRRCPSCVEQVGDDFRPLPATLDEGPRKEVEIFQSNCTSFFLEYLRQFCFSNAAETADMSVQVKSLLSELVVEAPAERRDYDCAAIDNNINTKSCVLRILLNNFPELTKNELNEWFGRLDRKLIEGLVVVVIKCFEDQVLLDAAALPADRMKCLDHWEKMLSAAWRNILLRSQEITKVTLLQNIAEIRCCIAEANRCIDDVFKRRDLEYDVTAKADNFITFAAKLCANDEAGSVMQDYVVKMACRTYGTDWFHQLKGNEVLENLIPISLLEASEDSKIDRWPLLGRPYTDQKTTLYRNPNTDLAKLMETLLRPDSPQNRLGRMLALLTWMHNKDDNIKNEIADLLLKHPDSGTYFFKYLSSLHGSFLPALKATQVLTEQQEYTMYQLVTSVVATVTSRSHMMDGFIHTLTRPSVVANMFLPGMPESPFFSVPADMRRQGYNMLYTCPNGHIYAIGECRRPMQEAKCADCGAAIGGSNHRSLAGNQVLALQDERTQAGYLLNRQGNNVVDASDRMSKQGAAVVHFLLHTCLLLGLEGEEAVVLRMVEMTTKLDAQRYLVRQLQKSLQTLCDALARNMDETVVVLHEIILRLLNQRQGAPPPDWSTLDKRRQWEAMFRENYLVPIFQDLDNVVRDAQERINCAEDQCSMALYRLVHEVNPAKPTNKTDFEWTDPMLWKYMKHADSAHLLQYLSDNPDIQEGVLKIILESSDLHLVKYLEPVLRLQSILIEKYQNETDMNDTERITFKHFEKDGGHSHRGLMDQYIWIWNKIFRKLKAMLSYEKRLRGFFIPIDIHSPISMGLPSTRGRGQCAKLLAEHLIDLQNDFLTKCKQAMKSDESIEEAEIPQLFHSHFVRIDKQEDLLPLIHVHTRYRISVDKQGTHHQITYNMDALEKQAREKFAMYKKLIVKPTLPTIQYPQDIGIGSDWDKVLSNIPQLPLSARIAQDVDGIVSRVTSADVCEGVRTLTHAISFLAKVKSNAKRYLYEFLEKDLLLSPSRLSVIPKSVQMEHTLSLYGRLSWHKAAHFALRGLNPYKDALATVEQSKITKLEVLAEMKDFFEHTDVVLLQQRLNEMLIKIPDFNADWSLTDIFPYFEFVGDDGEDDSWYARLPEEIHFKHVADLFSRAVNFTNQRP